MAALCNFLILSAFEVDILSYLLTENGLIRDADIRRIQSAYQPVR